VSGVSLLAESCCGTRISDYNREAQISANEFRDMGEGAVIMSGSTEWIDGRNGNQPRFNTVSGNYIHNVGVYVLQAPGIMVSVDTFSIYACCFLF